MRIRGTPSANPASITSGQSNKTVLTPSFPPWVLNLPRSSHNSDQKNCMIIGVSTVVEHAWAVMSPVRSVDWNWQRSLCDCVFQSSALKYWTDGIYFEVSSLFLAFLGLSSVRIFSFSWDSVVFDVTESSWSPSPVASSVSVEVRAVDKLLFREGDEFVVEQSPWLSGGNGTEGPTGTTLSLVFDRGYCSLDCPIDFDVGALVRLIDMNWDVV